MEYQTGALRGKNPCSRVGTLSGVGPTTKGFDSCRLVERGSMAVACVIVPEWG